MAKRIQVVDSIDLSAPSPDLAVPDAKGAGGAVGGWVACGGCLSNIFALEDKRVSAVILGQRAVCHKMGWCTEKFRLP